MEGKFFPALLPGVRLIVVSSPHPEHPDRRQLRARLGAAAVPGVTLHRMRLHAFDATFGGRWNAASNRRGGGTTQTAGEWVAAYRHWLTSTPH